MPFNDTRGQQSCMLVTLHQQKCRTSNNVCYKWTQLTGMMGTVTLDQRACLFKLHLATVHLCSTFSQPAAQASLPQGQQTYLLLRMFDYVALDQHICLKPSSYICNSFTRLAGMLQYPCFKRCLEPTGMFVAVAPDHLAHRFQLNSTSMHVC